MQGNESIYPRECIGTHTFACTCACTHRYVHAHIHVHVCIIKIAKVQKVGNVVAPLNCQLSTIRTMIELCAHRSHWKKGERERAQETSKMHCAWQQTSLSSFITFRYFECSAIQTFTHINICAHFIELASFL